MTPAEWSERGALFADMSRPLDIGLARWMDDDGHYQTTAQVPWDGHGGQPDAHGPPGYPRFVGIEGSIYKAPPRVVRGLTPLYRYTRRAGKTLLSLTTTAEAPGDGYDDRVLEGYVFARQCDAPDDAPPLILYRDGHGSFTTTTDHTVPPGFTMVRIIGWLPH